MAVTKAQLIKGLNEDLAGEFQAVIMYVEYSASVKGPYRQQLSQFFAGEIADELMHAQFLANKVAALGGMPTVTPKPVPATDDAKQMLKNVFDAEAATIETYKARIAQSEEFGDVGLVNQLENQVADETNHMEETAKFLENWS